MVDRVQPQNPSIVAVGEVGWSRARHAEPVTIGLPLPAGAAFTPTDLHLEDSDGRPKPGQVRSLDQWPDGSIRWALVDCLVDASEGTAQNLVLRCDPSRAPSPSGDLQVTSTPHGIRIATGRATFGFSVGGAFPLSEVVVSDGGSIDVDASGLQIEHQGTLLQCRIVEVSLDEPGPLRASVNVRGEIDRVGHGFPLEVFARIESFSATATLRISVTLRNRRRARHAGGRWTLGDSGSILLDSAVLVLKVAGRVQRVECAEEWGSALGDARQPFEIHQESSGGENWKSLAHRNRDGRVPLRFRGYRRRDGEVERTGARATPIVLVHTHDGSVCVAMPKFWQNFPRAIAVRDGRIEIGFFPGQSEDAYELQGGEQKTHIAVIAFASDSVSDPPLAWVHDPVLVYPSSEWCAETGALPFLVPAECDPNRVYLDLVQTALDPEAGFLSKRELADEYGWRHFGDLPADHESAFRPPGELLVSHYNNQYDAIACFATHFLRTCDPRWWHLMVDLTCHVRDIDIYHTGQDKAAYNGGLFWHTSHYFDAGTSTHRSYPRDGPASGGPSAEHNYNVGLMLHYFMTGEPASRTEAVNLGKWVIAMDDGRLSIFKWLAAGPTGLASSSGSAAYHGPGRGGANSALACLVAHRLSGDAKFLAKAEELIRRCIHPADDIRSRNLFDVESRWSYTVFLQVLGFYLHDKLERQALDEMFFYARDSLLHYARWLATHERPYLDHSERLEFPNETWPAQDLRKADALFWAALHAQPDESAALLARADFFREASLSTLAAMPGHRFTRPTVLVLANGVRFGWDSYGDRSARPDVRERSREWAVARSFEPQRTRAVRRARWLGVAFGLAVVAWAVVALVPWFEEIANR